MTKRVALITGVCGGIGRAAAALFRLSGWYVVGIDQVENPSNIDVDEFVRANVGMDGEVDRIASTLTHISHIDALINNAAIQINQPLVNTSDDQWTQIMNVNVRAAFQMIRAFHTHLTACSGAIVNVSSVHAVATSQNVAIYAVSKGALVALTRSAALELATDGIRCNAVLPGAVLTPMLLNGLARRPHERGPDGNLDELIHRTPLGFVATPEQIAPTILHLADSRMSPYTTGQMVIVDGGATIRLGTE